MTRGTCRYAYLKILSFQNTSASKTRTRGRCWVDSCSGSGSVSRVPGPEALCLQGPCKHNYTCVCKDLANISTLMFAKYEHEYTYVCKVLANPYIHFEFRISRCFSCVFFGNLFCRRFAVFRNACAYVPCSNFACARICDKIGVSHTSAYMLRYHQNTKFVKLSPEIKHNST